MIDFHSYQRCSAAPHLPHNMAVCGCSPPPRPAGKLLGDPLLGGMFATVNM